MTESRLREDDSSSGQLSAASPAGTVTFLLTDVEGSSRLWEADPDGASTALARGQEIIRDATFRHRGVLPLEQGEGDSSVSVFARASDAAACAVEIQRALGTDAGHGGRRVRVRIAIHTGEVEVRPDGTYRGAALNRCARLRSIGHGGQTLVSQATYEVLIDSLGDGFVLRDLGVQRLRDLARPEHVWQLSHRDWIEEFPPLRSLDAAANSLPVQLTSFIGRETEIDAISGLLGDRRMVTLIGAGGSGKTRLALHIAAATMHAHPDGVWWVDLSPLADPALVPAALAGVLGVRESPIEPIVDSVVGYLTSRRALIALDNCEHLIEACATLAARLVQGCPAVTVIATSREPLRVEGEATYPVPPLNLPAGGAGSLAQCESVRLFVDRARASLPNFALTEANASSVTEICMRLDGIPLAIELAAARARVLSIEEIAAGLADRFHLLTGGARSTLPRQRTLEASVDWSHDILDDAERVVFRRLAVFAGSYTRAAAEIVCSGDGIDVAQVLDLLSGLVDRSLVQVVDDAGSLTRYRMLETIRDYARHKLIDAGETDRTRERHLGHYVSFAEHAAAGLESPDLIAWLARIDLELDNLRACFDWSPRSSDPTRGQRLVGLLTLYFFARSELSIGRSRLEATLDVGGEGPDRADALSALCMVAYRGGDMVGAARHGDKAVALARRLADDRALGRALHWRAWVRCWGEGDRFAAWADFEEAAELLERTDDRLYRALNLALLAFSYISTTEVPRTRALLTEVLVLTTSGEAPHARCYGLSLFGFLGVLEGGSKDTEAHLREALTLAQEIGDPYAEICTLLWLGYMDMWLGRFEEGRDWCERGLEKALEHGSPNLELFMRLVLAQLAFAEGRLEVAARGIEIASEMSGALMPAFLALCRSSQAVVALAQSEPEEARRCAAEGLALGRETDTVAAMVWGLSAQAMLARLDEDPHRAEDLLHEALDITGGVGWQPAICETLDALAGAVRHQGRFEEAARLLGATQNMREKIFTPRFPVQEPSYESDRNVVREALGPEAFAEAWADGAAMTLDDVVAYARRGRGKRGRPTAGWNSLTPTEVRVVDLVIEGLTNPQIGEKLFVSPRTVQTHLIHVFAKLGVATRAELAAKAALRQAVNP